MEPLKILLIALALWPVSAHASGFYIPAHIELLLYALEYPVAAIACVMVLVALAVAIARRKRRSRKDGSP